MTEPDRAGPDERRRLVTGSGVIFLAEALLFPTGLILTLYLTRALTTTEYGLFNLATSLVTLSESLVTATFSRATIKLISEADDWRPVGAASVEQALLVGTAAMIGVWLLASPVAAAVQEPRLAQYLALLALDIPLLCVADAHQRILVGLGRNTHRAVAGGMRWVPRMILIVLLVEGGLSVEGAILGTIGATVVELAASRYFIRPRLRAGSAADRRRLWAYTPPLFAISVSNLAFDRLDVYLVRLLGGSTADVGAYSAAKNLIRFVPVFLQSFSPVLLSSLGRLSRAGNREVARATLAAIVRWLIALFPLVMALGVSADIVPFALGQDYAGAAGAFGILLVGAVAGFLVTVGTTAFIAQGWLRLAVGASLVGMVVGLGAMMVLVPQLGVPGAALAKLAAAAVGAGIVLVTFAVGWNVRPSASIVARSLAVSAIIAAVGSAWSAEGVLTLVKAAALGAAALIGIFLLGLARPSDLRAAAALLPGRRPRPAPYNRADRTAADPERG